MIQNDRNTRNQRGSHARGVSHTKYLAHGNIKGEARGRNRYKNHCKIVMRNMEGKTVGITRGKGPELGLTSTKDLTMELPEGHEAPYHKLT